MIIIAIAMFICAASYKTFLYTFSHGIFIIIRSGTWGKHDYLLFIPGETKVHIGLTK